MALSLDDLRANLLRTGMTKEFAEGMIDMTREARQIRDNTPERMPETTDPTTFRQWCEEILKPAVAD